jgi:putative ABC transport system permease protein
MEALLQDIRFGIRSLLKSSRFTIAALLTLALGIGANTAMFSVIHSVLLKPWPFQDPDRVLVVWQRLANGNINAFSTPAYRDWKDQPGLLSKMGVFAPAQFNLSSSTAQPERIPGGQLSYEMLPVLGVQPILGRVFSQQEDVPGSGHFVILSHALWKSRFSSNPGVLGSAMQINGTPYTVVGVMPAGFHVLADKELLWTPMQLLRDDAAGSSRNVHRFWGYFRLPSGVTTKQAQAEVDATAAHQHHDNPTADMGYGVQLQTFNEAFAGNVRPALLMLMGCVGFVLLIACTNVANLLLARGAARSREIAVRAALGASPLRVIRQLLTESVLLAAVGGALGVAFAWLALRAMLAMNPPGIPRINEIAIDPTVLTYTLVISLAVGILFGLVPAIEASRLDVNDNLRERSAAGGKGFGKHRSVLVITETALASILLIGTGLALKSLWTLHNVNLGFQPDNVLTFRVAVPAQFSGQQIPQYYKQVVEKVQSIPGVQSAALARNLPMSGTDPSMPVVVEGPNAGRSTGQIVTRYRAVGEDYFHTLQIPVLQGRAFNEHDTATAPPVAIVSESLARVYWPGESPIGKRLRPDFTGGQWCTIVGVVADVRHWDVDVDLEPTAYYPYTQVPDSILKLLEANMSIAVRSASAQTTLLPAVRAAVAGINKDVPIYEVQTMDSMVSDAGSLRRFDLSLLGTFSGLALALAAIGVYAVMAFSVSQRTREIGIRIALGALPREVLMLILRQGAILALIGTITGVLASVLLRKFLASFVYSLSSSDPLILSIVPVVIVCAILLACYLPARRASRLDPMVALRHE